MKINGSPFRAFVGVLIVLIIAVYLREFATPIHPWLSTVELKRSNFKKFKKEDHYFSDLKRIILEVESHHLYKVTSAEIVRWLINALLSSLTPHDFYLTSGKFRKWQTEYSTAKSLRAAVMLEPQVGYIKLERFTVRTTQEIDKAVKKLTSQGLERLILDLRGNSGGSLRVAVEVVDRFIPAGYRLLTEEGKLTFYPQLYFSTDSTYPLWPLIVLIDQQSASAAEIVAGIIQDFDRGLIIGQPSFGKALVQTQYNLNQGGLFITTHYLYLPSGRCWQRPWGLSKYNKYWQAAFNLPDRWQALKQAKPYRTLGGRVVYDSTGIWPDILVRETTRVSERVLRLFYQPSRPFQRFCDHQDSSAIEVKVEAGSSIFKLKPEVESDFLKFIRANSLGMVKFTQQERGDIRFLLVRKLVGKFYGSEAFWQFTASRDPVLQAALRTESWHRAQELLEPLKAHQEFVKEVERRRANYGQLTMVLKDSVVVFGDYIKLGDIVESIAVDSLVINLDNLAQVKIAPAPPPGEKTVILHYTLRQLWRRLSLPYTLQFQGAEEVTVSRPLDKIYEVF